MPKRFFVAVAMTLLCITACNRADEDVAHPPILTKEQALALASKGDCLICHRIEYRLVGPAWNDVAAKYRGDSNAVNTIASHIQSGGSFGWKFGVMPPRGGSTISDEEIANLARYIASLK
jgi:cytochrome c551/c552